MGGPQDRLQPLCVEELTLQSSFLKIPIISHNGVKKKNNNTTEGWFTVCPWSGEIPNYSPNPARIYEHGYALAG